MNQLRLYFVSLFASAYIVNFIYCTSRTVGDVSPHSDIDLTLRLGPPEAVDEPMIAQSINTEVNPAHPMQIIGSKRKRKYERYNVNPDVSERETADRSSTLRRKRNESSRLSAARRRKAIKEKGPEAVKAERAKNKAHQDRYIARLNKNPLQLEQYKAKKRAKAIERYRKMVGNQTTGEEYRNKLNEQQKMRKRLRKEQAAKAKQDVDCTSSGSQSVNQPLHNHDGLNLELSLAPPASSSKYTKQSVYDLHGTNDARNVQDHSSTLQPVGKKRKRYKYESVNPEIFHPGYRARTSEERKERRKFKERQRYKEKVQRLQEEGKEAIEEFRQVQSDRRKASFRRLYDDPVKVEEYREKKRVNNRRWYNELKQNDPIAFNTRREKANLSTKKYYHARKAKETKE